MELRSMRWTDYLLTFGLSSLGRLSRDWYFAQKRHQPLPLKELGSAALYSGVTGVAIMLVVASYKPEFVGSPVVLALSLLAGIGAVDLADLIYSAFRQWARKAAGVSKSNDENEP